MDIEIITIYYFIDQMLTTLEDRAQTGVAMTTAEVMTTAVVAARYFGGTLEHARRMLQEQGYIPSMLSRSRLNRRLHAISTSLWQSCLAMLATVFQQNNPDGEFIIDSFPVAVCDNIRIDRSRLYRSNNRVDERYRGKMAGKRRYFYGLRVHMLTTASGAPVECVITAGGMHDGTVFTLFDCDLPEGSVIYADKLYNNAAHERHLAEHAGIRLLPIRKKNMLDQFHPAVRAIQASVRKQIETSFSRLTAMFPKSIHVVTAEGMLLKLWSFILAFCFECLYRAT